MSALRLLETMRAEHGRVALLDRHLDRLASSAAAFGYPLNVGAVRQRLAAALGEGAEGVRVTLGEGGDLDVHTWALDDRPFRTVAVHPEPMPEAGGPLCVHKTTDRDHYERRFAWAQSVGADEALVLNPAGELMEGTRTSVWVVRNGALVTPPLASGGLAGVMRAHLLAVTDAVERVVLPGDLTDADALYLSNALRGWMPVALVHPGPPTRDSGRTRTLPPDP